MSHKIKAIECVLDWNLWPRHSAEKLDTANIRQMKEAMEAGLKIGVCTTSNEQAAKAITEKILKDIKFEIVLAGDVVEKKKPDPQPPLCSIQF